jgi:hypothetical protein
MTCKVVRLIELDQLVLLHISGHLQEVHVSMIEELIAKETDPVVLDLGRSNTRRSRGDQVPRSLRCEGHRAQELSRVHSRVDEQGVVA